MPIRNNLLQHTLVRFKALPPPLFDLLGTGVYRAAAVALRTGVFDQLKQGGKTPEELAGALAMDGRGLAIMLSVLEMGGYVEKRGAEYRNTAMTARWLDRASNRSMADMWLFFDQLVPFWGENLEQALRTGRPATHLHEWLEAAPERRAVFDSGLISFAALLAPEAAEAIRLPAGARRLLDVGGAHGRYSVAFCRRHEQLRAVIVDLPEALESGRATVADEGLADRIELVPADITRDPLGTGFDAVLLFNVIHYFSAADNAALVRRLADSVRPGGVLSINVQTTDAGPVPAGATMNRLLSLLWYSCLGGMAYTPDQVAGWFAAAGLTVTRRVNSREAPGVVFLVAEKPG